MGTNRVCRRVSLGCCAAVLAGGLAAAAAQGEPSLEELIGLARKRDADAEYALGMRVHEGRGVPPNGKMGTDLIF